MRMMKMTARCRGTTISRRSEGVKNMKIVCTKEEFASLIRWCERARCEKKCAVCPFFQCEGKLFESDDLACMCQIAEPEER